MREENIMKEVVRIIKNKPSLVRDTVEKKKRSSLCLGSVRRRYRSGRREKHMRKGLLRGS